MFQLAAAAVADLENRLSHSKLYFLVLYYLM